MGSWLFPALARNISGADVDNERDSPPGKRVASELHLAKWGESPAAASRNETREPDNRGGPRKTNFLTTQSVTKDDKRTLTPRLRFPEFRDEWTSRPLAQFAQVVSERVGQKKCTPYTVITGVGLLSQQDRFGRTIAGKALKSYYLLQENDFAYNKSATKAYPQGYIARFLNDEPGAVPNSIFTCFRVDQNAINPAYLDFFFAGNRHGRWLRRFVTIGARAHGSLNVNDTDLMALPIPLPDGPSSLAEQQKIADCLTSLDELIAGQGRKVEALKVHKQGLMQRLFPRAGETLPRLRFPEFRDAGPWEEKKLSTSIQLVSGVHLSQEQYNTEGELPYFTGPSDFTDSREDVTKWTAASGNAAFHDDTLITVKGSGVGELWYLTLPVVAMGRQLMAVRATSCSSGFVHYFLMTKRSRFEDLASGNLIPGLSRSDILDMLTPFPSLHEQQRIADCLFTLDTQISAEADKLAALKTHKRGLMRQLFPSPEGD